MRKYSTSQLLSVSLSVLFIASLFLAHKGLIFKNIFIISFAGIIFIQGRNLFKSNSNSKKGYGSALMLLSITTFLSLFADGSTTARNLTLICFLSAIVISIYTWSKNASEKPLICTLWLLLFPPIMSVIILALIDSIIELQTSYNIILFCILYCGSWILMAKNGKLETTSRAIIYSGITSIIILMLLTFTVDIFAPLLTKVSILNTQFSNPLAFLGYNYNDVGNIVIKLITFPSIILSAISHIIISNRKNSNIASQEHL